MIDDNYINQSSFEAFQNGDSLCCPGPYTQLFIYPADRKVTWYRRDNWDTENVVNFQEEVVAHAGRTLIWIANSLANLRRWMNEEVTRSEQGISEPIMPPQILEPDTSIRDPHLTFAEGSSNTIFSVNIPTDYGDLVFYYSGSVEWQPGGLASGQNKTLDIPPDVTREAAVSVAQMVNSFRWSRARANER